MPGEGTALGQIIREERIRLTLIETDLLTELRVRHPKSIDPHSCIVGWTCQAKFDLLLGFQSGGDYTIYARPSIG
jgi:hypothetical protein